MKICAAETHVSYRYVAQNTLGSFEVVEVTSLPMALVQ